MPLAGLVKGAAWQRQPGVPATRDPGDHRTSPCPPQIEPETPLFGFIGRLEEQKGVDILLEALPQILEGRGKKPVQLVVLGTGKKVQQ